jgi:cytochrome b
MFEGPFYSKVSEGVSRFMGFIHGWMFNLLLVLVILHVAVIALYFFWKRENLVRAMVTGRALLPKQNGEADFASPFRALVVAVVAAVPPVAIYVLN